MNGKEESWGGRGRLGLREDRDVTGEGSGNSCNMYQFGIMGMPLGLRPRTIHFKDYFV